MKAEANSIVSFENELLILVDPDDRQTGSLSKSDCHDGDGVLHRAFSVFLFNNEGELLLQQRSSGKRLWPLYWTNTCCSHPRAGETMELATGRRLRQELGISAPLEFVYKFAYRARFGELGSEHELCSVFLGRLKQQAVANETEIEALRFIGTDTLNEEIDAHGERFTPWFKMEWQRLNQEYSDRLLHYTSGT